MGPRASQETIEEEYLIVEVRQDGSALLKHKKTQEQYQLRSHCSNIQDQIAGFQELLERRQKIKSIHLLDLVQIRNKMEKQICSVLHRLYLLIQYPFKTLDDEIKERKMKNPPSYFVEDELWSILYSCSAGIHTLYQNKFNHQALSSKQVFINKEGLIKISDPLLLGLEKNYIIVLKNNKVQGNYVSPQIMNFLDDCNFSFYDKELSDVFVLGTIMLEASLLASIDLYDSKKKRPQLEQIPFLLQELKKRYSENYVEMIRKMLQIHSKNRMKLGDIVKKIEHENSLLDQTDETQNMHSNLVQEKTSGRSIDQFSKPSQVSNLMPRPQPIIHQRPQSNSQFSYPTSFIRPSHSPSIVKETSPFHDSERFSQTKFGNISMTPNNQKNQALFSYDIPEIRQILQSQKKASPIIPDKQMAYTPIQQSPSFKQEQKAITSQNVFQRSMSNISSEFENKLGMSQNSQIEKVNTPFASKISFISQKKSQIEKSSPLKDDSIVSSFLKQKESKIGQSKITENYVCELLDGGGRYQGYKKDGMKNGYGKLYFRDGGFYDGEWKDNRMDGYGKLHYENGQIAYDGHWIKDEFNGEGRVFNDRPQKVKGAYNYYDFTNLGDKWIFYEGNFKNDSKHGKGKIKLTNGEVFEGNFNHDLMEGEGNFYSITGHVIHGYWKNNVLINQ